MAAHDIEIRCDLHLAHGEATILTTDLCTRTSTRTAGLPSVTTLAERVRAAGEKAIVLAEALPYIREFSGRTVVIKYGGPRWSTALADLFATDVVLMQLVGMHPVVVHGGGPQISTLMRKLGKEPEFVDGRRVTDEETMDIVRMALVGKVNREIVASINRHGPYSVGLSGEDAGLIRVDQRDRGSASSATCVRSTRRSSGGCSART
jgi:hypothetical protein